MMPHIVEASCRCGASADAAWAAWTDPGRWPGGPIVAAGIDGPFAAGSALRTKVRGFPAVVSTISVVQAPRLWVNVARSPGVTMTYEHHIAPDGDGCVLTEIAHMTGPLAPVVHRVLGRRIRRALEQTTANCARIAACAGRDPESPGSWPG